MKSCPRCQRTYDQPTIRFCLDDGELLSISQRVAISGDTSVQFDHTLLPPGDAESSPTEAAITVPDGSPDPGLPVGAQVGEYVVERQIGEGGMGKIFAAAHPIIGKRVAIKLLNRMMSSDRDIVNRFIQEAKSVNQIRHPNIVDIFAFGALPDGQHYFVMELLEGESLASRLRRGRLPWPEAVEIWLQIVSAIEAAHQQGIVHRDLKPDNVYLCQSHERVFVKVLDFGIAKLLGDSRIGMSVTSTGVPIGTPSYMSPEQAAGGNIDYSTDLYALGVILFETVARRTPFVYDSLVKTLNAHMNEPAPPLEKVVADVEPGLAALVASLLAKEPEQRPRDMGTVKAEIVRLRDAALARRRPLYGDVMPETAAPASTARRPLALTLALAAIALVVVAGAGAALLVRRPPPPPAPPPVVVAPPPAPVVAPAPSPPPAAPKIGRLLLSLNTPNAQAFLDPSAGEHAAKPAAAGGSLLRLQVPPDTDWVLRVEAAGFKTFTTPLRIAAGEEQALPLVLTPEAPPPHGRPAKSHASAPAAAPAPAAAAKGSKDGRFLDPFAQ
jgi:tRNA A-37 threonylcarbamoyl transferase component Bud32